MCKKKKKKKGGGEEARRKNKHVVKGNDKEKKRYSKNTILYTRLPNEHECTTAMDAKRTHTGEDTHTHTHTHFGPPGTSRVSVSIASSAHAQSYSTSRPHRLHLSSSVVADAATPFAPSIRNTQRNESVGRRTSWSRKSLKVRQSVATLPCTCTFRLQAARTLIESACTTARMESGSSRGVFRRHIFRQRRRVRRYMPQTGRRLVQCS